MFNLDTKFNKQKQEPTETPTPPEAQETMPDQPEPETEAGFSEAGSADGAHIDALLDGAGDTPPTPPTNVQLDKASFHKLFCGTFTMASHLSGLKTLAVNDGDGRALAASEALYETIEETPALHFLIQPSGKKMQRIIAIATFAVPLAIGVRNELAARHGAPVGAQGNIYQDVNMGA